MRACILCRFGERFKFGVGQHRDHRGRHHAAGNPRIDQCADGVEAALGRRRARFHHARQIAVQHGHRQADLRQFLFRHGAEDIDVAGNQARFGDDADRVVMGCQHFEYPPCQFVVALDRLIGVGIGAYRHDVATVRFLAEFCLQ